MKYSKEEKQLKLLTETLLKVLSNYIPVQFPKVKYEDISCIIDIPYGTWRVSHHNCHNVKSEEYKIHFSPIDDKDGTLWVKVLLLKFDNNYHGFYILVDLEVISLPYLIFKPISRDFHDSRIKVNDKYLEMPDVFKGTEEQVKAFHRTLSRIKL